MCDVCSDFLKLLSLYEGQISRESNELALLTHQDISTLFIYIQTWPARQCMCCFRDPKNIERFSIITQGVIHYSVCQLKELSLSESLASDKIGVDPVASCLTAEQEEIAANNVHEIDKLLILVSKIFVLNFPLYSAYKQYTIHRKLDELTQQEVQNLNVFCDLQDTDIPINLIKNVGLFCKYGGLLAMTRCFTGLSPKFLPVSTAHAMISIVCNLKIWMNYKSIMTMLVPLRSCVLRYMCKLSDRDLRTPTIKSMADFMWNAIKDPLEHPVIFDLDGLDLAFKYFTSSTLTMRLAGITQINSQIGMLAEMCVHNGSGGNTGGGMVVMGHLGSAVDAEGGGEAVPRLMCDWLLRNGIVVHLFGPNMHAEVIKQSHIILNFLAMENRLSSEHIDTIWAAAQLKHCAKPVHDLLPGLVKHLSVTPALHLYSLLMKLPPKDHTEQTLYLTSALIKFIWTRAGGAVIGVSGQIDTNLIGLAASASGLPLRKCEPSSSENSVSLDASNSEEEHGESSDPSDSHELDDDAKSDDSDDSIDENCSNRPQPIVTSPRSSPPASPRPLLPHNNNSDNSVVVNASDDRTNCVVIGTTSPSTPVADGGEVVTVVGDKGDKGGGCASDGSGPTPCKIPRLGQGDDGDDGRGSREGGTGSGGGGGGGGAKRSEHLEKVRERLVEKGRMEKERLVGVGDVVVRSAKGKVSNSTRKKQISTELPGGIEIIATSSSQDEGDIEAITPKYRKRRKVLKRARLKDLFREKQLHITAPTTAAHSDLSIGQAKPTTHHHHPSISPTTISAESPDSDHHQQRQQHTPTKSTTPATQMLLQQTLRAKSLMVMGTASAAAGGRQVRGMKAKSTGAASLMSACRQHHTPNNMEVRVLAGLHDGVPLDADVIAELGLDRRFGNQVIATKALASSGPNILELSSGAEEDEEDEDGVEDADGSYSSRMSNKSEKNMADFDGEESVCEEELAQLAESATMNLRNLANQSSPEKSPVRMDPRLSATFTVENVCKAGNTLLWDLLQDDKIGQLGEGLAVEAEKTLCNLLCYNTDRTIRMKFIEGCLHNLANNTSVLVSLRLLPKLLTSFQQFRGLDIHHVTQWADRQHHMMKHFFANLRTYVQQYQRYGGAANNGNPPGAPSATTASASIPSSCSSSSVTSVSSLASDCVTAAMVDGGHRSVVGSSAAMLYTHQMQVQVRLHFLTSVYSPLISPSHFKLSLQQLDTLWSCLSEDQLCSDELFSWLLTQAKSSELHALGIEALKRLYNDHLPHLSPATFSATGLSLFQQLCNLTRIAASAMGLQVVEGEGGGVGHMWRIALRAYNTEVSMSAIQYLNSYYMSHNLQHEDQFVAQCMSHLAAATDDLDNAEDAALLCIQRALLLLKTHIETFKRRYAYHLRRWALEGQAITCHAATSTDRSCPTIRLIVQPGGMSERCMLDLLTSDYVADLRAEISKWWEDVCMIKNADLENSNIFADSPIRIITQGQELTTDCDEKTLGEMGFKDNQMIYISMSVPRNLKKRECLDSPSLQPPPSRQSIPTLLLLRPLYFEQLFALMHTLGAMAAPIKGGQRIAHTKAQVLSRRVWDILLLLPTNSDLLSGFERLEGDMGRLLDPSSAQKLMYSLYIIEGLSLQSSSYHCTSSTNNITASKSTSSLSSSTTPTASNSNNNNKQSIATTWNQKFVQSGGLRHLFDIFMSGVLQSGKCDCDSSEWQQDCLATLLKLLCQLGVETTPRISQVSNRSPPLIAAVQSNASGIVLPDGYKTSGRGGGDRIMIARLNEAMLSMLDVKTVMPQLTNILNEASLPRDPNHFKTGFWGRAQVVHYAMSFLVSWLHCNESARRALFQSFDFSSWLQRLVLDDPEPAVRREMCSAIYRLCLGVLSGNNRDRNNDSEYSLVTPMLCQLLQYMDKAESMRPHKEVRVIQEEEGKEPYGPACRDYFWLVSRLVDSLPEDIVKESLNDPLNSPLDLDSLTSRISDSLVRRECLETRHCTVDDDGLIGLLNLLTNLLKHKPMFQINKQGRILLTEVFDFLFALPHSKLRHVPKCKSGRARTAAFDLLVELVKAAPENYDLLFEKLLRQHQPGPNSPYPWDYWPHEDGRSECGYVGLTNLGATCYMASCMQHLYMMPQARASILAADTKHAKHESTLRELQRMFAYLSESERKAYNPRSFCKVYTMDHQPLNTAEQKDMAEFFIDLVSKLEEMTPTLKNIIKELFCGVLTNNVVSLDCDHVSRTIEEFYTVRCQVADMRNLYESLDEVTVKDTLEGDNMYTCSQCGKKVRAEKRACFKKLPHILCFNTMRYTFNMLTMLKEKVNTHFSFPLRLNMAGYMDRQLMPQHYQEGRQGQSPPTIDEQYEYDLIGVTVHTGTADGGHYYSFIKDRTAGSSDKWFLFNDAEVKPFDPNQIAAECYGGEMTSKTYDSVTDKFMDFNFEKTNSAYMLFYERCPRLDQPPCTTSSIDHQHQIQSPADQQQSAAINTSTSTSSTNLPNCPMETQTPAPCSSASSSGVSSCSSTPQQQSLLTDEEQQQQQHSIVVVPSASVSPTLTNVQMCPSTSSSSAGSSSTSAGNVVAPVELSSELEDWIWQDNMHFIQDKNIFEHTYFNFMWQICGYIPSTIMPLRPRITERATQLSASFFMETFIHAKEKPTMVQWVELVTKQFNQCQEACVWFLEHMASDTWWPVQVLLKCPNQMVRQMFQRLCIHVIQRLRSSQSSLYLLVDEDLADISENDDESSLNAARMGNASCVTKFVKTLLSLMAHGAKAQSKHLTEYFGFLYEFSRMGEDESKFLLNVGAIHIMVDFYLGYKINDFVDVSEGEEEEEPLTLPTDKHKPASLDKMVTLVASLVEKSRDGGDRLLLSVKDYSVVAGGKGFPFLYHQIKDNINLQQTKNLIHSLCRGNDRLATAIIGMLFQAISRNSEACQPFFKLLTLLTESSSTTSTIPTTLLSSTSSSSSSSATATTNPSQSNTASVSTTMPSTSATAAIGILPGGLPGGLTSSFTHLVLQRVWEAAECCPYNAIEWLAVQVNRSRVVHQWVLGSLDTWLEHFLIGHGNQRVRNAAGNLLISLVPSAQFRQCFRGAHRQYRDPQLSPDAVSILHQVYGALLRLISSAKHYTDIQQHGTMKLTTFCGLLMFCCISRTEKLMFGQYFIQLWQLFHPKLAEPAIPAHHNKQAVLVFWNHVCADCPENVQLMLQNTHVTKNIAFNYILADHEDQEIVIYNRAMLPAYYGLLRMMCQQSRIFTRQLAQHQNLQWAFKNITPHPSQYPNAVEELFKLMQLMVIKHPETTEVEEREICNFRRTTLTTYAQCLDGRCWTTLISAFRILVDSSDDRLFIAYNGGLQIVFESFQSLHMMLHEATACHVSLELIEVLSILIELMRCVRVFRNTKEARDILLQCKDWIEVIRKLASLLNTYNPPEMRLLCIDILKEFVNIMPNEVMQILVPLLTHCHGAFQDSQDAVPLGPYFPRRHLALPSSVAKGIRRPLRPMVQMTVPQNQLECAKGVDAAYDDALEKFYAPYHEFIDRLCRLAVSSGTLTDQMVSLCSIIGFEAVPLHFTYFPRFWLDTMRSQNFDRKYLAILTSCNYCVDYIESVLLDERVALTIEPIYEFLSIFFPKVSAQVLTDQTMNMIDSTVAALPEQVAAIDVRKFARRLSGDLRACLLAYRVVTSSKPPPLLVPSLKQLQIRVQTELSKCCTSKDTAQERLESEQASAGDDNDNDQEKPSTSKSAVTDDGLKKDGDVAESEKHLKKTKPVNLAGDEDLAMLDDTIDHLLHVLHDSDDT